MAEEYLYIVDENNVYTGEKISRKETHGKGIWHRTVHLYLYRENEKTLEFLVHLRSMQKDSNPGKWDTRFGWHVEFGQDPDTAVKREAREETGLDTDKIGLENGMIRRVISGTNKEFTYAFYGKFPGKESELEFNDGEVQEVKWMNDAEILESMDENPQEWSASKDGFIAICDDLRRVLSEK